jgi:hypothetical protein
LVCMEREGCSSVFTQSNLARALPPDMMEQLANRQQNESLSLAGM